MTTKFKKSFSPMLICWNDIKIHLGFEDSYFVPPPTDNLPHGHPQLANWTVLALNNICQLWRARSTGCNKSKLEKDLFTNNMFSPTTSASSWRRIKNMFWSNFATASSSFVDSNSFDKIQEYPSQRKFFEPNFNFLIFVT